LLADRLQDDDRSVRLTAAAALRRVSDGRINYDPDGSAEAWRSAAEALLQGR
jgi:hypothetical protein